MNINLDVIFYLRVMLFRDLFIYLSIYSEKNIQIDQRLLQYWILYTVN